MMRGSEGLFEDQDSVGNTTIEPIQVAGGDDEKMIKLANAETWSSLISTKRGTVKSDDRMEERAARVQSR